MRVVHSLKMDLVGPWGGNLLHMVQGDSNTRIVELRLFSNGAEWIPTNVGTVSVAFKKPDQTKGLYDSEYTLEGNTLQVVLHPQVLTAAGKVIVSIILFTPEGNSVASFPFGILVDKNPSMEVLSSEDYFDAVHPFIATAIQEAHEASMEAYEAAELASEAAASVPMKIEEHNTSVDSHQDIRLILKSISDRLTAFFDSDDQTLDELSEIVAYVTSNRSLINSITTKKVNISDIIDNLTTNVANKPLSAAQGVVLKSLIDKLPKAIEDALAQAKESGEFDGEPGKTAYQYAVEGGYTGTEAEFTEKLKMEFLPTSGGTMTGPINMASQPLTGLNPPTGETEAATKGYVDTSLRKAAPRNLLDNSDFRNPVNQRGQSSYNLSAWGGYCIDRWAAYNASANITIGSGGLTLSGGIHQPISSDVVSMYNGKVLTLAVKIAGTVYCCSGEVNQNGEWNSSARSDTPYGNITFETENNNMMFVIIDNSTTPSVVEWAALYEGEYTAETLPEYQPKGHGAELAECQRYYYRRNFFCVLHPANKSNLSEYRGEITFPVEMRTNPQCAFDQSEGNVVTGPVNNQFCLLIGTPNESGWCTTGSRLEFIADL